MTGDGSYFLAYFNRLTLAGCSNVQNENHERGKKTFFEMETSIKFLPGLHLLDELPRSLDQGP